MKIEQLTEKTVIDNNIFMPMDVSGDARKIKANKIGATIANNLTTTEAGYVLDATQGKVLSDQISANATAISQMTTAAESYAIYKSKPWTFYDSRSVNNTNMEWPTTANEIMIIAYENNYPLYFSSIFIPSMITEECYLHLGGFWQQKSAGSSGFEKANVKCCIDTTYVKSLSGKRKHQYESEGYINPSGSWSTEIWYR